MTEYILQMMFWFFFGAIFGVFICAILIANNDRRNKP